MSIVAVEVSADDFEIGVPKSCRICPVARALLRAGFNHVRVYRASFHAASPKERSGLFLYPLSQYVRRRIARIDDGLEVEPFSFDVDLSTGQRQKVEV